MLAQVFRDGHLITHLTTQFSICPTYSLIAAVIKLSSVLLHCRAVCTASLSASSPPIYETLGDYCCRSVSSMQAQ